MTPEEKASIEEAAAKVLPGILKDLDGPNFGNPYSFDYDGPRVKKTKVIMAGGVAAAVSSDWDEDAELRAMLLRAFVEFCRELQVEGYITVSEKWKDGDYTKQRVTLEV